MLEKTTEEKLVFNELLVTQSIRRLFTFQEAYDIKDRATDQKLFWAKRARFFFHKDVVIFDDPDTKSHPIIILYDETFLDAWARFRVHDLENNEMVGVLKRRFWHSLLRERWEFQTESGEVIGWASAKSMFKTIVRKFGILSVIPIIGPILQIFMRLHFEIFDINGNKIGEYNRLAKLRDNYTMTVSPDAKLDRRLILAASILFDAAEGAR